MVKRPILLDLRVDFFFGVSLVAVAVAVAEVVEVSEA